MTARRIGSFRNAPSRFENSEPLWRMLGLVQILQHEFRVRYNPARIGADPDWTDSRDLFIHGLLGPERMGTCPSIPVLIVAIGRRLGYPLKLVRSPGHVVTRWDGMSHENSAWQRRFNIEFHGDGMESYPDERYYTEPVQWTYELRELERSRGDRC